MLPHHHHEEVVCYTSTHCETETDHHDNDHQDHTDHSHDHTSGEDTQHCLSLEFYVKSGFSKSNKRIISLSFVDNTNMRFSKTISNYLLQNDDLVTKEKPFKLITEYSIYSVFAERELPLRGPPSTIV